MPVRFTIADALIIQCLQKDARRSVAQIADQLAMPESTVRHRLNRLVQHRMIEFVALTNPLQLGYGIWVMIDIQVEPTKIRRVARKLAEATEVYFVGITTGSHDISIGAIFKSTTELLQFITERLGKIPGIVRTTTSSVLEVVKRTWTHGLPIDVSDNGHRVRRRSIAAKAGKQN